jgi:hypothetical protein
MLPNENGAQPFREVVVAKDSVAFALKDRVTHSVFGLGTISGVNDKYTTIVFDERGTKKIETSLVQLGHSTTPAPGRSSRAKKVGAAGST